MRLDGHPLARLASLTPHLRPGGRQMSLIPPYRCQIHRTICHHAHPSRVRVSATPQLQLRRGAKTQTKVKLKDLPQGVVKLDTYEDGVDNVPQYPTVVQGHRNNMQKFSNCVILTRVGGFYEVRQRIPTENLDIELIYSCSCTLNKPKNLHRCSISSSRPRRPVQARFQWLVSHTFNSIASSKSLSKI